MNAHMMKLGYELRRECIYKRTNIVSLCLKQDYRFRDGLIYREQLFQLMRMSAVEHNEMEKNLLHKQLNHYGDLIDYYQYAYLVMNNFPQKQLYDEVYQ